VALAHLAFHSLYVVGSARYVYPMLPLEITLAAVGIVEVAPVFNAGRKSPLSARTIVVGSLAFLALSSCLLLSQLDWSRRAGSMIAFDQLSLDPSVCGVGVYRFGWWNVAGYTHLHRNVPIIIVPNEAEIEQQSRSFNALLAPPGFTDPQDGFELAGCWSGYCLFRRPGPCTPPQGVDEFNLMLFLHGY
jgi:hypothetical protein